MNWNKYLKSTHTFIIRVVLVWASCQHLSLSFSGEQELPGIDVDIRTESWQLFNFLGEDITEDQDGGIVRSVIADGEGYQTPRDMATCDGRYLILKGKKCYRL